jgi:hypothetical protein
MSPKTRNAAENIPEISELYGLTRKQGSFPHLFSSIRCAPTKRVGIVTTANAAESTHDYNSGQGIERHALYHLPE